MLVIRASARGFAVRVRGLDSWLSVRLVAPYRRTPRTRRRSDGWHGPALICRRRAERFTLSGPLKIDAPTASAMAVSTEGTRFPVHHRGDVLVAQVLLHHRKVRGRGEAERRRCVAELVEAEWAHSPRCGRFAAALERSGFGRGGSGCCSLGERRARRGYEHFLVEDVVADSDPPRRRLPFPFGSRTGVTNNSRSGSAASSVHPSSARFSSVGSSQATA